MEPLLVFLILFLVLMIVSLWKVFEKAGQPGWAALIPIYNVYVLTCEIAQKELIWFLLFLVPFLNIAAAIVVYLEVANKFGQSALFGLGLVFLGFIFVPMLAFGPATYEGRGNKSEYEADGSW